MLRTASLNNFCLSTLYWKRTEKVKSTLLQGLTKFTVCSGYVLVYLLPTPFLQNIVDSDPVGAASFGRIRIVTWENGSGTDPGSEKKSKNIRILYYFKN